MDLSHILFNFHFGVRWLETWMVALRFPESEACNFTTLASKFSRTHILSINETLTSPNPLHCHVLRK